MALAFVLNLLLLLACASARPSTAALGYTPVTPDLGLSPNVSHSLGTYAPWFASGTYASPPAGCSLTQVNILQRHGARYPTDGPSGNIQDAVKKLQDAGPYKGNATYGFIDSYTYTLGLDDLVPFGAAQSYDAGQEAFVRYSAFVEANGLPFVRASSAPRVVYSAKNWTAGFAAASQQLYAPTLSVIINEPANDTLIDGQCPEAGTSDDATDTWLDLFGTPAAQRLTAAAAAAAKAAGSTASAAKLKKKDWQSLISLCAFDSVAFSRASPWCGLFSQDDFDGYEYRSDLDKYYGTGYGQALGPVQGVGYVNELLARLTSTPVADRTQTNRTLDSSPVTFPLGRAFYADFSHDDELIAIYAALGLRRPAADLDPSAADPARTYIAATLVPFSARMAVERLACSASGTRANGTYVRVLINDALEPLAFCGAGDGLCELAAFVTSQSYARNNGNGDWEKCFD